MNQKEYEELEKKIAYYEFVIRPYEEEKKAQEQRWYEEARRENEETTSEINPAVIAKPVLFSPEEEVIIKGIKKQMKLERRHAFFHLFSRR